MILVNDLEKCGIVAHCKSGSSSIRHALSVDWKSVTTIEGRRDYIMWNVVRHPLSRFVSAWWSHTPDRFPVRWEEFVDWALETVTEPHIIPQTMDSPEVDCTIVKLEIIGEMAAAWRSMNIGIKTIYHLNASDPIDWRKTLQRGYRVDEIIALYGRDLTEYGYEY